MLLTALLKQQQQPQHQQHQQAYDVAPALHRGLQSLKSFATYFIDSAGYTHISGRERLRDLTHRRRSRLRNVMRASKMSSKDEDVAYS